MRALKSGKNAIVQRVVVFAVLGACSAVASASCGGLSVSDAWLRAAPGASVVAAYFTLANSGDVPVTVQSVASPAFKRAAMHKSISANGMASMQPIRQVEVQPGAQVAFAPGGRHVMLFDPQAQLHPGDTVQLTLQCAGGQVQVVEAAVRGLAALGNQSGHGAQMQHDASRMRPHH